MSQQTNSEHEHPAVDVLRRFFKAMNEWELRMIQESHRMEAHFQGMSEDQIEAGLQERKEKARARLASVFAEFCEAGVDAKRVRDVLHFGSEEPDYNPDKEKILSVVEQGNRVTIETQMTHQLCDRLKYELVKVDGNWKVRDNRKFYAEHYKKWHRMDL